MGFIENLRRGIEERLIAGKQEKTQAAALQAAQEAQTRQQEAAEKEFHRKRRAQAEAFQKESGIDIMLSSLYGLLDRDPARHGQRKGHVTLFKPRGSSNYPEAVTDFIKVSPRQEERSLKSIGYSAVKELTYRHELDEDAIFDVIILGEHTSSYSENHNAETDHYAIYLVTETTPDGDIVLNSSVRDIVPKDIWGNDKGRLEDALGKAFSKPSMIHSGRSSAPSGYNSGHS